MASHSQVRAATSKAGSPSLFVSKRQSPTEHLQVLRAPSPEVTNTTPYLSPGLHNGSDTWVRFLRSRSHQFVDEYGDIKNQHLLKSTSVQQRKQIRQWCDNIKKNARAFTLGIHDELAAAKMAEYFREQAELSVIEDWSEDYEHQDDNVTCAVEDWSEDYEHQVDNVAYAVEDWTEGFEEQDKQHAGAIEDWSEDFEETNEQVEHELQLGVSEGDEISWAAERPASSSSSVSTVYDTIFDSHEGSPDHDESISIYAHDGPSTDNNNCKDSVEALSILDIIDEEICKLPCACLIPERANAPKTECGTASIAPSTKIECSPALTASPVSKIELKKSLRKEKKRKERLANAEDLLASAWRNFEGYGYTLTRCVWRPVESQNSTEIVALIGATSPVPVIHITTPEGQVYDLLERASSLPLDWDEYLNDRDAAQGHMAAKLKKHRGKYEKYSEYCRRLESEAWWKERQARDGLGYGRRG